MSPEMIVLALQLAREAFAAAEPTEEQLAIRKAATDAKVDAAVAEIDAAIEKGQSS